MDPFSLAAVGAGLSAAGGAVGAAGALSGGESTAKMYQYRAGVAKQNAVINRQNSDFALEAGETNVKRSGLTTGFTIAKQKVGQAANGFDVNTGTNKDVRDATDSLGREDQSTIANEFGRKALGFRNAAAMNENEATMDVVAGENAKKAGKIQALSTLLGTAGSVASKWTTASQAFGSGSGSGVTTYGSNMEVTGYYR